MQPRILFEDNHLLAIDKPAMLATMGASPDRLSLLDWAKDYLKVKYQKPGNVYLGIVSRLDAPVTGVLLIARTSKAAARLTKSFQQRDVDKVYWAIVHGPQPPRTATLEDWLRKDEQHRKIVVCSESEAGSQQARLSYRLVRSFGDTHVLEVHLETGRKHQIRVQLSHHGLPILGDRKYDSLRSFPRGIALHSRQIKFNHPVGGQEFTIEAPLPASWGKYRNT